jgi:hypothetical protein
MQVGVSDTDIYRELDLIVLIPEDGHFYGIPTVHIMWLLEP